MNGRVTVFRVIAAVAARHGVGADVLAGRRRPKALAAARQEAMYAARVLTPATVTVIARCFGGRHHTSILHGIAAHARRAGLPAWDAADPAAVAAALKIPAGSAAPGGGFGREAERRAHEARLAALVRACIAEAAEEADVPAHRIWGPDASRSVVLARAEAVRRAAARAPVSQGRLAAAFGLSRASVRRVLMQGEARA